MNKRAKKKAEARRRAQVHRILNLVLDINGTHPRTQKLTGNLPTAFLAFDGHTAGVDVRIFGDGWYADSRSYDWFRGYLDRSGTRGVAHVISKTQEKAAELRKKVKE